MITSTEDSVYTPYKNNGHEITPKKAGSQASSRHSKLIFSEETKNRRIDRIPIREL